MTTFSVATHHSATVIGLNILRRPGALSLTFFVKGGIPQSCTAPGLLSAEAPCTFISSEESSGLEVGRDVHHRTLGPLNRLLQATDSACNGAPLTPCLEYSTDK